MLEIFPDNIFVQKYLFFAQGTEGDCWLLASIISLFHGGYDFTKLVQQNKKGDFLIKLFGVDNTYTIEQETFKNYRNLCGRIRRLLTSSCITIEKKIEQK